MEIKFNKTNTTVCVGDIADIIEKQVPSQLQEEWDNSGLLIGFENKPVSKILTCLEIDKKVLDEAIAIEADMIITHHPLIFSEIKALNDQNYKSGIILELIRRGISVYSCHTPFDKVKGGNNDILMNKLELGSVKNLSGQDLVSAAKMIERKDEADIGRTAELKKPITYKDFLLHAADKLDMSIRQLHAAGDLDTEIQKVGCCTGAGADLAMMAAGSGCQLFITGDVKYHEAQDVLQSGMCILDAGHYGTEKFFAEAMKGLLDKKLDAKVQVVASEVVLDPFVVL
ncbi:MAG: Nif3-like dinuclear metal center hexameric protein [Bacillota bacterium]|nr:Nif3-like dinuclear metal center hexameric protein [Bacillota bacterium]